MAASGDHVRPIGSAREGLELIAPLVARSPAAFSALARNLGRAHMEQCEKADIEPDSALLQWVAQTLAAALSPDQRAQMEGAGSPAGESHGGRGGGPRQRLLDEAALAELPGELADRIREAFRAEADDGKP